MTKLHTALLPLLFIACFPGETTSPERPTPPAHATIVGDRQNFLDAAIESTAPPSMESSVVPSAGSSARQTPPAERQMRDLHISYRKLVDTLSERNGYYFSDNYVSNETSYLQVALHLPKVIKPGGAYIGVGPEQNFSYIALTHPDIAFIVDIRRGNMLVHLLYKSIFDEATSRSHFLSLLLGRPYAQEGVPDASASIEEVITHAIKLPTTKQEFARIHRKLMDRIQGYGFELAYTDRAAIKAAHREFFRKQLEIKFELHMKSKRNYPTLRTLLTSTDPSGNESCFLATERAFRLVQKMQKENRIVPVVGDFGGTQALHGIAEYLQRNNLCLSAFYVSNVEEYLLQDNKWDNWVRNINELTIDDESVFIRSYLARAGRTHPLQQQGHWSTTFLQRIRSFQQREKERPSRKWHDVATHALLTP